MPQYLLHRRWLIISILAVTAVLIGWLIISLTSSPTAPSGLGTRTTQAGPVTVEMTALQLDASGAQFRIVFTTHTGALTTDPATAAQLHLDGTPVTDPPTWTGPGPGGHHRTGTLCYTTPIRPGTTVELRLTGLPGTDATGTWKAP
jgi:hypothetical protein